jgi:hypothetical protein
MHDVAYVAMIVHVCYKCMFLMFHLFFFRCMLQVNYLDVAYVHTYVASVLSGCCMCLQLFFKCFHVFLHVFQAHISNVSAVSYICCNCFIWMFQSRSRVLCILQCESLTTAAYRSYWGTVHGGERCSRRGGTQEARKRKGVARAGPAYACNRHWRGRLDVGGPPGHPGSSAAVNPLM